MTEQRAGLKRGKINDGIVVLFVSLEIGFLGGVEETL
jgi:hypothetical protein